VPPLLRSIGLTVTDTVGQTNTATNPATLQDNLPVAAFTIAPPVGLAVSVDASASTDDHGIASYAWNWGDSTTGTGVTASHTYGASGTYTITLTVTDSVGQTSLMVSHPVTVSGGVKPVASFTATVAASGYVVTVDASASTGTGGIVSYSWNWGDLIAQNGLIAATATHTYATNGVYTITLTVKDTLGQTGSVSHDVTISGVPIPPNTCLIYGMTWASDGVTQLAGCTITITDVRTGTTLLGTMSDDTGYYNDINILFPSAGDTIIVNAIGPAGQTGSGTGVLGGAPYLEINVILTG
jgi:PKD repeat protein